MNVPGLPDGPGLTDDQGRPLRQNVVPGLPGGLPATDDQGKPLGAPAPVLPPRRPGRRPPHMPIAVRPLPGVAFGPDPLTDALRAALAEDLAAAAAAAATAILPLVDDEGKALVPIRLADGRVVPAGGIVDEAKKSVVKEIGAVFLWTSPLWLSLLFFRRRR